MKVGDRVKTLIGKYGIPMFTEGCIYEIEDATINGGSIWYRFISDEDNDYQGLFLEHELKIIEKKEDDTPSYEDLMNVMLDSSDECRDAYATGCYYGWNAYSKIRNALKKLLSYGYTKDMIAEVLEQI